MSFNLIPVTFLVVNEVINFISLGHARNEISLLDLHIVQNLINFHVSWLKIRSRLNKRFSKLLTGLLICSIANVTLPKTKNFTDQIVFEKLHRG